MIDSKKIRLSILDLYIGIICLFPISTALLDEGSWNKIMFAALAMVHLCMMFYYPMKRKRVYSILLLIFQYLFALGNTSFPMENSNLLFYYPFFVLYTCFMIDNGTIIVAWFKRNKRFVHFILVAWTILIGFSIFLPDSYFRNEGNSLYFGSYCRSSFRLGPSTVFIQVLTLVSQVLYKQRKSVMYMLVPMYSVMMGNSRTYAVIGFLLFVISWYVFCKSKKLFWGTLIPLGALLMGAISVSAIADKIIYTLDATRYGGFWFSFTNSRNVLWSEYLTAWRAEGIIHKLFGCGLNFTIDTTGHWAHNDFIEVLCSFGIVGLLTYIQIMKDLYCKSMKLVQAPSLIKYCIFFVWAFNAFFNMYYTYFCAMLCYPLLLFVINWYFANNPMEMKWIDA